MQKSLAVLPVFSSMQESMTVEGNPHVPAEDLFGLHLVLVGHYGSLKFKLQVLIQFLIQRHSRGNSDNLKLLWVY
jgi:hypothetical protein